MAYEERSMIFDIYKNGGGDDELPAIDKARNSSMMTDSMKRREALKAQSIDAAAKSGKGYRQFETPNQPDNFGVPITDGFGYC